MIRRLSVKDFAILEELEVSFNEGLTVITGETGAGKSLILKSLSVLLGAKGEKTFVRSGAERSVLELEIESDSKNFLEGYYQRAEERDHFTMKNLVLNQIIKKDLSLSLIFMVRMSNS